MSEKQFEVDGVEVERFMLVFGDDGTRIVDNQTGKELYAIDIVGLLNEQQAKIQELERKVKKYAKVGEEQLKQIIELQDKLKEKEEDEQLYANEIVKLNKEAKEVLDFKSLGGDY